MESENKEGHHEASASDVYCQMDDYLNVQVKYSTALQFNKLEVFFYKRCIYYLCFMYRFNHWFFINPAAISSHIPILSLLFSSSSALDRKCFLLASKALFFAVMCRRYRGRVVGLGGITLL